MALKFLLAGAMAAGSLATASAAAAATIDTTPFWDGSSSISSFGAPNTSIYGETFTAPQHVLDSFTVYVDDGGNPMTVNAQVYAWSGSLTGGSGPQGAVGPALFSGANFTIPGVNGFQAVTVNTLPTDLTVGGNYVLLLEDQNSGDGGSNWANEFTHPGVAGDGGFNFYNAGVGGAANGGTWDDFSDFGSLSYTAAFSVPEPAQWALLLVGIGLAGAALRRHGRVNATLTA